MAKTYMQLINEVLLRLREDEQSSPEANTYTKFIGALINDAKRAVEDAWAWPELYTELSITTSASTHTYAVTGSNQRTSIREVIETGSLYNLQLMTPTVMGRKRQMDASENRPTHYTASGVSSDLLQVSLYPTPDAAYTLSLQAIVPQADLSAGTDTLSVPFEPVVLRAWAYAIKERGEDQGTAFAEALDQYRRTLGRYCIKASGNVAPQVWTVR